jgi:hypothetical protein
MKMNRVGKLTLFSVLVLWIMVLAGCGGTSSTPSGQTSSTQTSSTQTTAQPSSTPKEQPVPVISGTQASGSDIPDTQVFVKYTSTPGKYQLEVPEGWAQTTNGTDVNFASNLNAMQVTFSTASTQPTASSVRNDQAVTLQQTGRAVLDVKVQDVQLPGGPAVLITYTSNSDPNSVTNKQVRLENNRYLYFNNGKLATLTLSAPVGADNVDQWLRIARSFKWV